MFDHLYKDRGPLTFLPSQTCLLERKMLSSLHFCLKSYNARNKSDIQLPGLAFIAAAFMYFNGKAAGSPSKYHYPHSG